MQVELFSIAEFASLSADNQRLTVAGSFDMFEIRRGDPTKPFDGPVKLPPFYLAATIIFSLSEGLKHQVSVRMDDEDGHEIGSAEIAIELRMNPHGRPMRHNLVVKMAGVDVPRFGDYAIWLGIDGKPVERRELYVVDVTGS